MKKRFETINGIYTDMIKDNQTNKAYGEAKMDNLTILLNKQDKKIKELIQENQQLTDIYDKLNKKYCEEMDKNIELQQSLKEKTIKEYLFYVRKYSITTNKDELYVYKCKTDNFLQVIGEMHWTTLEHISRIDCVKDTENRRQYWKENGYEIREWRNKPISCYKILN